MKMKASNFKLISNQSFDKWLLSLVEVLSYRKLILTTIRLLRHLIFIERRISTGSIQAFFC